MINEKELNEFYGWEKEEIDSIILILQGLYAAKIDEEAIKAMNACERSLSILREKYTSRLLATYKRASKD